MSVGDKVAIPERVGAPAEIVRVRAAYLAITLGLAAIVASGFWPSYFGPLLGAGANRLWIIHLHAAVFVGWILLLLIQAFAVALGRIRVHRLIGRVGGFYGALVLGVGMFISVAAPVARVHAGQMPAERAGLVALYNLTDILVFGAFFIAAMIYRGKPDIHRRLIVSATVALAGAAVGRVLPGGSLSYALVWLSPLLAVIAMDLIAKRRVHAISLASVAIFAIVFLKVTLFSYSNAWRTIGGAIVGPFI